MGDAAHVGSFEHEVFQRPFRVNPVIEQWRTPDNYRRFPDGEKLPGKMAVWRIQEIEKTYGSVCSRFYGFTDSPDAEILVAGYNEGKEYGAVGVGRQGNFMQWGFCASPEHMTPAGKAFFLNCICYIKKFDGHSPLIQAQSSDRTNAIRLAAFINEIKDENFFLGCFPKELYEKYKGNPEGLVQYYRDDFEFIYRDEVFQIDKDLKSLGLESNRKINTLERLINLLTDELNSAKARSLLIRYTEQSFDTFEQWQEWFRDNRDRIYFSDVGGYKFFVIPEGYRIDK